MKTIQIQNGMQSGKYLLIIVIHYQMEVDMLDALKNQNKGNATLIFGSMVTK